VRNFYIRLSQSQARMYPLTEVANPQFLKV